MPEEILALFPAPDPVILPLCRKCDKGTARFWVIENFRVCYGCAAELDECEKCRRVMLEPCTTLDGDEICGRCADRMSQCVHCGEYGADGDLSTAANGDEVCDSCQAHYYWTCDECDELIRDGEVCDSCPVDDDDSYGGRIYDYDYQPEPSFHGEGPLYLGLELELNHADSECAQIATDHLGDLGYLKDDSSLNCGFEIVTHPMSHAWARDYFPWHMLRYLADAGAESRGAGLHVHVSRAAFNSPAHVFRWLKLIYRNEAGVTGIARRRASSYAGFNAAERDRVKHYAKGDRCGQRYSAVNVLNSQTFEVRVFASSLNPRQVQAALDLVAASVEYTRELTVSVIVNGGWTWEAFGAWVAERPEYAALAAEMDALCV